MTNHLNKMPLEKIDRLFRHPSPPRWFGNQLQGIFRNIVPTKNGRFRSEILAELDASNKTLLEVINPTAAKRKTALLAARHCEASDCTVSSSERTGGKKSPCNDVMIERPSLIPRNNYSNTPNNSLTACPPSCLDNSYVHDTCDKDTELSVPGRSHREILTYKLILLHKTITVTTITVTTITLTFPKNSTGCFKRFRKCLSPCI